MFCPKCDENNDWVMMDAMGYGDYVCPKCGYVEYADNDDEDEEEDEADD